MVEDDPLYRPLATPRAADGGRPPRRIWGVLTVAIIIAGAGAAVFVHHADQRTPAEVAIVPIEVAPKPAPPAPPPSPRPSAASAPAAAPENGNVEIQHGVKIIRLNPATSPASVALPVPDRRSAPLTPAPDPRVTESTPIGPLPRIGPDGARPAVVYARPPSVTDGLRIALVVAGLGRNQVQTAEAAQRLPPAVTFAFPPDGPDLPAQVAEARAAGHEVILQLQGAPAQGDAATDQLHRQMARFAGYAGVSLPDSSDPAQDEATVRDLRQRGLYILATTTPPPAELRVPDMTTSAAATPQDLERLIARARATGSAIGWIASPDAAAAEVIAQFTESLAQQRAALVPLSALADNVAAVPQASK